MIDRDELDDLRITGGLMACVLAVLMISLGHSAYVQTAERWRARTLARAECELVYWRTLREESRLQIEIARAIYCQTSAD